MNWPNALSLSRIGLAGLLAICLLTPMPLGATAALFLFAVAAATDAWDGQLARRTGQITPLGMMLDPLADKVLVCAAMVSLVEVRAPGAEHPLVPAWTVIVVLTREFLVTGLRTAASRLGRDIPAGPWGKHKTAWQMLFLAAALLALAGMKDFGLPPPAWGAPLTRWTRTAAALVAAFTAVSGLVYLRQYAVLFSADALPTRS